jgi:hypothetical protein
LLDIDLLGSSLVVDRNLEGRERERQRETEMCRHREWRDIEERERDRQEHIQKERERKIGLDTENGDIQEREIQRKSLINQGER